MQVTYDSSDLLKCNVSFAYSRYYIDKSTSLASFINPTAQANYNNVANGFSIGGIPKFPAMKSGNQLGLNDLAGSLSGTA